MNYADAPVFIISSERSGTNLLRKRLTDSQKVYLGPSPAHFLKHLYYQQPYYNDVHNNETFLIFLQQAIDLCVIHFSPWDISWSAEELLVEFGDQPRDAILIMHFMMNKYAAEQGCDGYICKDNYLYEFALEIERFIPNAKFIYLYRDPRDYVLSQLKRPGAIKSVYRFATLWSYEQTKSIAVASRLKQNGKCLFLAYEDFVSDESGKLKELMKFLEVRRSKGRGYQDIMKEDIHEWNNINSSTKKDNFNKFLEELTRRKIRAIERTCYLQMSYLGYPPLFYDGKETRHLMKTLSYLYGYILSRVAWKKRRADILTEQSRVIRKVVVNYRSDKI